MSRSPAFLQEQMMIDHAETMDRRRFEALTAEMRPRLIRRSEKLAKRAEAWMGLGRLRTVRWEPYGPEGQCYQNAQRKCLAAGGSVVLGWSIFHEPGVLLAAYHHAIWRSPDGQLIDLETPWAPEEHTRLTTFLPDPSPLELVSPEPIDDSATLLARPRKARVLALSDGPRAKAVVSQFNEQIEREALVLRTPVYRQFHDVMLGRGTWLRAILAN
jgi:hypothetical protein